MDKILMAGKLGKLAVQVTEHHSVATKLIKNVHVEQLSETSFKVSLDFNMDPLENISCNVSTGDGWNGVDFMNDSDSPDFSMMAVMFKWLGEEKTDLELSWTTWDAGDETDLEHFSSTVISEILVTQVLKREGWDGGLTLSL